MKTFEILKNNFPVNWTTVLVGWEGLGIISPWPDKWIESSPLLTVNEVYEFCYDRISKTSDAKEISLILEMLEFEKKGPDREFIGYLLTPLSELYNGDKTFEIRKWRAVMLGELLERLQGDALSDSLEIGEFWMYYGFPPDSPMKHSDIDNVRSDEYGSKKYINRVITINKEWLQNEIQTIMMELSR